MTTKGHTPNDEEIAEIADDFANREFSNDELAAISNDLDSEATEKREFAEAELSRYTAALNACNA